MAAALGPVGIGLAAVGAATGLAVVGVKKFADSMEAEARKLADKSPDLAMATAQTDINREMASMRRAERIGPKLSNFERVRSKAETALYEIGTEIKDILLKLVEPLLPLVEGAANGVMAMLEMIRAAEAKAGEWMAWIMKDRDAQAKYASEVTEHMRRIREIMEGDEGDKLDDITKAFLSMDIMGPAGGPRAPIRLPAGVAGGT